MSKFSIRKVDTDSEKQIITSLIVSDSFCREIIPVARLEYFSSDFAATIFVWVKEYYEKYQEAPKGMIQNIYELEKGELPETLASIIGNLLDIASKDFENDKLNASYLSDKALEYFDKRSLLLLGQNITRAAELGDVDRAKHELVNFKKAEKPKYVWINPLEEKEITKTFLQDTENRLFKFPGALGDLLGWFETGWLIAVMGPAKRGKTNWLWEFTVQALINGLRVAVISLEMTKAKSKMRFYKRISGLADVGKAGRFIYPCFDCYKNQVGDCDKQERINQEILMADGEPVPDYNKKIRYEPCDYCREKRIKDYEQSHWFTTLEREALSNGNLKNKAVAFKRMFGDNLRVSTYPAFSASIDDIKRDADMLEYRENFIPHVWVIDYADICQPSDKGLQGRDGINSVWKGLKQFAGERSAAVVTASHSGNKKTLDSKNVRASDVAEDTRKLNHVDLLFALNQTAEEKKRGIMRVSTSVHRHEDFNPYAQVTVLQNLFTGQTLLDSEWGYTSNK